MFQVTRMWARTFDIDHIDLWWEIKDTVESFFDYTIYVERSESPEGPYEVLTAGLKDVWHFRDIEVNLKHRHRQLFYRLRIVHDATTTTTYSDPVSHRAPEQDPIGREITRRFSILLQEFVGLEMFLFPVRTFGTRCPECWNEGRSKRTKDRCITCFGVGFAGGFMHPVRVFVQLDPPPKAEQVTGAGTTQHTQTSARTLPYPPFKPKDILIDPENRRWRVAVVNETRKLGAVVHQELQLLEVAPGDIVFKLPVNIDVKNYRPGPGREYARPMHPLALGTEDLPIPSILAAYGYPYVR